MKADVGTFSRQIELALVYDGKLDVTELPQTLKQKKVVEIHGHRVTIAWAVMHRHENYQRVAAAAWPLSHVLELAREQ
jgi:hypothetical protein